MGENGNSTPPNSQSGDKNQDNDCDNPNLKEEDFKAWLWCQQQEGEPPVSPDYTDEDGNVHKNEQKKLMGIDLMTELGIDGLDEPETINYKGDSDQSQLQILSPVSRVDMDNDYLTDWAINPAVPEIILSMEFQPAYDSKGTPNIIWYYIRSLISARKLRSENIELLFEKLAAEGDDEVKALVAKMDDKFAKSFKHKNERFNFYSLMGGAFKATNTRFETMVSNGIIKARADKWYKSAHVDAPDVIRNLDDVDLLFDSLGYANSITPGSNPSIGWRRWTNTKVLLQAASDLKNLALGRSPFIFGGNINEQRDEWWDKIKIDPSFTISEELNTYSGLYEFLATEHFIPMYTLGANDDNPHPVWQFHSMFPITPSTFGISDKLSTLFYLLTRELKFSTTVRMEGLIKQGAMASNKQFNALTNARQMWGLTSNNPLVELIGNIPENIFVPVEKKNRFSGMLIVDKDQYDNPEEIILPFESYRWQYYSDEKVKPGKLHFYEYLVREKPAKLGGSGFNTQRLKNYHQDINVMASHIERLAELTFIHPSGKTTSLLDVGTIIRKFGIRMRKLCKIGLRVYTDAIGDLTNDYADYNTTLNTPAGTLELDVPKSLVNMPEGLNAHQYPTTKINGLSSGLAVSAASQYAFIKYFIANKLVGKGDFWYGALFEYIVLTDAWNMLGKEHNPYTDSKSSDALHIFRICNKWLGPEDDGTATTDQGQLLADYNKNGHVENWVQVVRNSIENSLANHITTKVASDSTFETAFGGIITKNWNGTFENKDGSNVQHDHTSPAGGILDWGRFSPNLTREYSVRTDTLDGSGGFSAPYFHSLFADELFPGDNTKTPIGYMLEAFDEIMIDYQNTLNDDKKFKTFPTANNGYSRSTMLMLVFEIFMTTIDNLPGGCEYRVIIKSTEVNMFNPIGTEERILAITTDTMQMIANALMMHHITKIAAFAGVGNKTFDDLESGFNDALTQLYTQLGLFKGLDPYIHRPMMLELYRAYVEIYKRDIKNTEVAYSLARLIKTSQIRVYGPEISMFDTIINQFSKKLLDTTSSAELTNPSIILREYLTMVSPHQLFLSVLESQKYKNLGISGGSKFYANEYKLAGHEYKALQSMLVSQDLELGVTEDVTLSQGINFTESKQGRPLRILTVGIPSEHPVFYPMSEQTEIDVDDLTTTATQDNFGTKDVGNNFIKIYVYRRDPEFPQIVFKPKVYVFDITRFTSKPWNIKSVIPGTGNANYSEKFNDIKRFGPTKPLGPTPNFLASGLPFVKADTNSGQFNNPAGLDNSLGEAQRPPWQEFINDPNDEYDEIGLTMSDRKRIVRNHCVNSLLGDYIKVLTSIDTSEGAFTDLKEGMDKSGLPGEYLTQEDYDDYRKLIAAYIKIKTKGATLDDVIKSSGRSGKFLDQLLKLENATGTSLLGKLEYTVPDIPKAAKVELTEDLVSFINLFTPDSILNAGSGMNKRIFRPKLFGRIFNIIVDPDDFYIDPKLSGFIDKKINLAGFQLLNNKSFQERLINLQIKPNGKPSKDSLLRLKLKPKDPREVYISEFFVKISRFKQ